MKTVTLCVDVLQPETWHTVEVADVCAYLASLWGTFPSTGRIYHEFFADTNDVTPHNLDEIARLQQLDGKFFVVVYPEDPVTITAIVAIALAAIAIGAAFLLRPGTPHQTEQSPNNQFADRQNKARPNERIPDIVGTVRSTPDLIAVPYKIFFENRQYEICYMCASRGSLTVLDCLDDTTPVTWIDGEYVAVYGPNTSPNGALPKTISTVQINSSGGGHPVDYSIAFTSAPIVGISYTFSGLTHATALNGRTLVALTVTGSTALFTLGTSVFATVGSPVAETGIALAHDGSLATPQITFGTNPLPDIPVINAVQASGSVNGQVLRAPNSGVLNTNNNVSFLYPDTIQTNGGSGLDFTDHYVASTVLNPQYLNIYANNDGINASDPGQHVHSVAVIGRYKIVSVTSTQIVLTSPSGGAPNTVSSAWNIVNTFTGHQSTYYHSFQILGEGNVWVGPYVLQVADLTEVWATFVSAGGLYYIDDNGNQHAYTYTVQIGVQGVDANNAPIGDETLGQINLVGSSVDRIDIGSTLKFICPSTGAVQVRAQLVTPKSTDKRNQYNDQIQWRDLFAVSAVLDSEFGNVTTVLSITTQTQAALSIRERKINMLVTRNIPTWNNRTGFALTAGQTAPTFGALQPSNNAADILCFLALDPAIGRRTLANLNVPAIYSVADASYYGAGRGDGLVSNYFKSFLMTEFCATLDDTKKSFEETVSDIAQAINCVAYRRGSSLSLYFEQLTSSSALLFNHRNKIPNSETRTVSFGTINDNDGIEFDYIDPDAPNHPNEDATVTIYLPSDQSAKNPKKVTSSGVRNRPQATLNAWRLYQKLIYQNSQVEFEATQESDLLILYNRILVADNTRPDTQDGELTSQNVLLVTTSQPLTFVVGQTYTAFFQHYDQSIESIGVTQGPMPNSMILATAPSMPFVTDIAQFARTTYILVGSAPTRSNAFLLAQKEPQRDGTFKLTAVNYDDKYYLHDVDILNGVTTIPVDGYGPQGYTGIGATTAGTQPVGVLPDPPRIPRPPIAFATYSGSGIFGLNNLHSAITTATGGIFAVSDGTGSVRTVTADALVQPTDGTIRVDCTSAAITLTLPIDPFDGQLVFAKKIDASANAVTIDGNGNLIDGAATATISAQYAVLRLQFDTVSLTWGIY
jgi:hypothetical protein